MHTPGGTQVVTRGIHEQNSVTADAKSKNSICTEGQQVIILVRPSKIASNHCTNYNFALYFIQLKHFVHFAHILNDHTEAALP